MDRKVIVLSPSEWEDRITIGEGMKEAYQHSHYAVTDNGNLVTVLWNIERSLKNGESLAETLIEIEHAKRIAAKTTTEIRESQKYLSGIASVIKYKLEEESQE